MSVLPSFVLVQQGLAVLLERIAGRSQPSCSGRSTLNRPTNEDQLPSSPAYTSLVQEAFEWS
jgi:hypothetical protein